jgi:UDP-3-O-[3-hydroxymyristoyl] glucosamine N-acyltransferase
VLGFSLHEIVLALGGELLGDPDFRVYQLRSLTEAKSLDISFVRDDVPLAKWQTTQAGCLIVSAKNQAAAVVRGHSIITPDPYLFYARLSGLWRQRFGAPYHQPGIHPSAVIESGAIIDQTATIGPLSVVESGAHIGARTVLVARVHIARECIVGDDCILHPGVVVGADGFGFARRSNADGGGWEKIEQLGAVRIGNQVEIGANTCVDRGALQDTVIEDGVKLDNLIQIGHNVKIGSRTAIAACVAIAGSTSVGSDCTIGGTSNIAGHLTIADGVHISGATTVMKSVLKPGTYTGVYPMEPHEQWEKTAAGLRRLSGLRERIQKMESKLNGNLSP